MYCIQADGIPSTILIEIIDVGTKNNNNKKLRHFLVVNELLTEEYYLYLE
jgi:hypothetical protein